MNSDECEIIQDALREDEAICAVGVALASLHYELLSLAALIWVVA